MASKTYGYILNGKLHAGTPPLAKQSSQFTSYDQEQQRTAHVADLIQPRLADGSINPEFEWVYPEESKIYKGDAS